MAIYIIYSLYEIKNCYQIGKFMSFKYKITVECDYKMRTKDEVKIAKCSSKLAILIIIQYMKIQT